MTSYAITYQLDVYDAAGSSVAFTLTSIAGGTNPYLDGEPSGDGQTFDPLTAESRASEYTGTIIDVITSGTTRVVTSQLEDANFRQQLMRRKAILKMTVDGSTTVVLVPGKLTRLTVVSAGKYEYAVTDPSRLAGTQKIFTPRLGTVVTTGTAGIGATSVNVTALTVAIAKNTTLNFGSGKIAVVSAAAAASATSISFAALTVALVSGDVAQYKEPISTFLARWPNRGCALGGPVIGGFLNQPDTSGWEMRFESNGTTSLPFLRFVRGWGPPNFTAQTSVSDPSIAKATNDRVGGWVPRGGTAIDGTPNILTTAITTFDQAERSGFAGDLMLEVMNAVGGATYGYFQPSIFSFFGSDPTPLVASGQREANGANGIFISGMSMSQIVSAGMPASGTSVRVRAWTPNPSEVSPIYWTGHPVDLVTTILTELGYSYDSASATTVKNAIGADLRLSIKVTEAQDGPAFIAANALGPFGIGIRVKDNGDLELFAARILSNAAPSTTITDADIITPDQGGAGPVFNIAEVTAVQKVSFTFTRLTKTTGTAPVFSPDGFTERSYRVERINADPGVVGTHEQAYTIAGMIHRANSYDADLGFFDTAALEIFDRLGRGGIECELPFLRGGSGDALRMGDEAIIAVTQLPNKNKRYGDDNSVGGRAMQIVRYTPRKQGALVKLLDSGPNAAAYGTTPTISIAASASQPKRVAMLTITNAATLNASGAGARIRMATTTGSAPASTDFADAMSFPAGQIPTAAFALPSVIAGRKVYATAAATHVGSRQSAYATAVNVTLTTIAAPSGFTATASGSDGSTGTLAWTVGETDHVVDIYVRPTSGTTSADNVLVDTVVAGSTGYVYDQMHAASVGYTFTIQHRDPVTNDTSATTTATLTAAAEPLVLSAPTFARGFSGNQDASTGIPALTGLYGVAVKALAFPQDIEAQAAVETGVGSGTYGDYAVVGRVAGRQGSWTPVYSVASNDGLRRQIITRHIRPTHRAQEGAASLTVAEAAALTIAQAAALYAGAAASAFSSPVIVTPYTVQAMDIRDESPGTISLSIRDDGTGGGTVDVTVSWGSPYVSYKYAVSTSLQPTDASARAGTMRSGRMESFSIAAGLALGDSYYLTAIPFTGASATGNEGQSVAVKITRENKTSTKTIRLAAADFVIVDDTQTGQFLNGEVNSRTTGSSSTWFAPLGLPTGATLTGWRWRSYLADVLGLASIQLYSAVDGVATLIDTDSRTGSSSGYSTRGTRTVTQAINNSTAHFYLLASLNVVGVGTATNVRMSWVDLDYTVPALDISR